MWRSLLLALALLPGLAAPAVAQSAGPSPEITKHIADVASADSAVQEAAAVALGKTGDRKILPLLEALREGSVYVRSLTGGKKETVIVGDKVSEGDKTLVPLFAAYGRESIAGPVDTSFPSFERSPMGVSRSPAPTASPCWPTSPPWGRSRRGGACASRSGP